MANSVIGVFSPDGARRASVAGLLGKKGSADDITIYNTSYAGRLITAVEPTLYPKKLDSMLFSAYLSDYCIVCADALSAELGEIIVALDLAGKKEGCLCGMIDWDMFTKGTSLEKFTRAETDKEAAEKAMAFEPVQIPGATVAVIDHSFDVKGVGSVALGFVKQGQIKVHDKFQAWPSEQELEIRSIQMQDKDQPSAASSDRFGISFKGMKADELDRGMVLSQECDVLKEFNGSMDVTKFCKRPIEDGEVMHFACGMQMQSGKVATSAPIKGGTSGAAVKITLDQPMAHVKGEPIIACRLNEKMLRAIGRIGNLR